jgi:hypothetical protein
MHIKVEVIFGAKPLKHRTFVSSIHSWSEKMIKNTLAAATLPSSGAPSSADGVSVAALSLAGIAGCQAMAEVDRARAKRCLIVGRTHLGAFSCAVAHSNN